MPVVRIITYLTELISKSYLPVNYRYNKNIESIRKISQLCVCIKLCAQTPNGVGRYKNSRRMAINWVVIGGPMIPRKFAFNFWGLVYCENLSSFYEFSSGHLYSELINLKLEWFKLIRWMALQKFQLINWFITLSDIV